MLAPTRSPRSRPHGAPAVIWCTRAETSPAAAASARIETPSARAEASAQARSRSACSRRHAARDTRGSTHRQAGHPVRDRHADTLPLPTVFSKLDGLTRFLAPLLPEPFHARAIDPSGFKPNRRNRSASSTRPCLISWSARSSASRHAA